MYGNSIIYNVYIRWSHADDTYRIKDVKEREADLKNGGSKVTDDRTSGAVVAVTSKQALLDAVLVRLVTLDRTVMS